MIPLRAVFNEAKFLAEEAKLFARSAIDRIKQPRQAPQNKTPPAPDTPRRFLSTFELFFGAAAFVATVIVLTAILWPLILVASAIALFALYRKFR